MLVEWNLLKMFQNKTKKTLYRVYKHFNSTIRFSGFGSQTRDHIEALHCCPLEFGSAGQWFIVVTSLVSSEFSQIDLKTSNTTSYNTPATTCEVALCILPLTYLKEKNWH